MGTFTGDPLHGEHEVTEPSHDADVTRAADKQRYEAQKNEAADYPGDSGAQAQARLKDDAYHGGSNLRRAIRREAEEGTDEGYSDKTPEAKGQGSSSSSSSSGSSK
jgi:hypothetical protein